MAESKELSKMTPEELMEIAKLPLKESDYKHLPPARRFIVSDGLETGTDRIPGPIIYDRYYKWSKINNIDPIGTTSFFKEFKMYFKKILTKSGAVYLLSPKGFDLSLEKLEMTLDTHYSAKRNSRGKKGKAIKKTI